LKYQSENQSFAGIPLLQVRGSSILFYSEPVRAFTGAKSIKRQKAMLQNRTKAYSGGLSQGSRKRLAKAVTIMTQAVEPRWITNPCTGKLQYHRFAFITLTVSCAENITAREAYDKLFNHFLDWMTRTAAKKTPALKTYIWKAELQKRGQIHYHITTPGFLHWQEIRDKWNSLQRDAGLLEDYAKKNGHYNPNSTDIHDTRKVAAADRYMIKELCKTISAVQVEAIAEVNKLVAAGELSPALAEEKVEEIKAQKITTIGKIWGCSEDLAGVSYFTIDVTRAHDRMIDEWIERGLARKITDDYFAIVYCEGVDPPDLLNKFEKLAFKDHLKNTMSRSSQQPGEVPAACVQMNLVDVEKDYTFDQLQLNFN
jgi:hypothetical protein